MTQGRNVGYYFYQLIKQLGLYRGICHANRMLTTLTSSALRCWYWPEDESVWPVFDVAMRCKSLNLIGSSWITRLKSTRSPSTVVWNLD